jgi:hypothetical protein
MSSNEYDNRREKEVEVGARNTGGGGGGGGDVRCRSCWLVGVPRGGGGGGDGREIKAVDVIAFVFVGGDERCGGD